MYIISIFLPADFVESKKSTIFVRNTNEMILKYVLNTLLLLYTGISTLLAEPTERIGYVQDKSLREPLGELFAKGKRMESERQYSKALYYFNTTSGRYTDNMNNADKEKCAEAFCRSGDIYYKNRQYTAAMNQYLGGLRIGELNSLNLVTGQIYMGIGNLYSSHGDYDMGIRYYKHALLLEGKEGNTHVKNNILNNLIGALCFAGRADEGEKYLQVLKKNIEKNHEYKFNMLMCTGIMALCTGDTVQAISIYTKALTYAKKNNLNHPQTESANSCLAQIYLDLKQPKQAIEFLLENKYIAEHTKQADLLEETMRSLSSAYFMNGNRAKAMEYKIRSVKLYDSLYNNTEFNSLKNTMFLYEANKSENAIRSLRKEKQDRDELITLQRGWIITLVIAFIVFLLMLAVVYRQKKQLYTTYRELYLRNMQDLNTKQADETCKRLTKDQRTMILEEVQKVMLNADEICNSNFNIGRLASLVGSNSRYVSEAINEEYGKNFRSFLNEYRIKEAMRRLADTEKYGSFTIKAISESVGYKSQANFISVFTKVTGMKPSIYQKLSKE